jgi:hypothetical protein
MMSKSNKVLEAQEPISLDKTLMQLSLEIENLLVSQDLRGMKFAQNCLAPGYIYRAAILINQAKEKVLIGTGFPVLDTFETDGPVGAIVLYDAFVTLGLSPIIACGDPLYSALNSRFNCLRLSVDDKPNAPQFAQATLAEIAPSLIVSIERPGLTADGTYRNMFGDDISLRCASFDDFINYAPCPTIGIGDGGNEIGMGNIKQHLTSHNIMASHTCSDELLVADVSNWTAYGILGLLSILNNRDLLAEVDPLKILQFLSDKGSVDGVTKKNTLTEDSLSYTVGVGIKDKIRRMCRVKHIIE